MKIQELIEQNMRSTLSVAGYNDEAIRRATSITLDRYTRYGDVTNAINHGLDYAKRNLKHERKVKSY